MGSIFRYIADNSLEESGLGDCQHCRRRGVPSYRYNGLIINPQLAANTEQAIKDNEIYAACANCINGGNLRKGDFRMYEIQPIINSFAIDKEAAARNYHLIPQIPCMLQRDDWPMCCGDWCEFIGNPEDDEASVCVPSQYQLWDERPVNWRFDDELLPEDLFEVSLFRCLTCPKKYFIWQST